MSITEMFVRDVVQGDAYDVGFRDALGQEMIFEQFEQKIGLAAPSDAGYHLHGTVPFPFDHSVEISVAIDFHDGHPQMKTYCKLQCIFSRLSLRRQLTGLGLPSINHAIAHHPAASIAVRGGAAYS
ncbi:hypothetical protein [Candidatus Methanomethylophilus sp. 1R26]|uniref:hypothetical protein n=1 Tax=Candidatus Methanomethylophilus sp. 1R26 TaxID=1769296 RepID=UPI00191068B8|nr:hypothetical protein [Candidatus Methanomethylophilus sp. 1R26]